MIARRSGVWRWCARASWASPAKSRRALPHLRSENALAKARNAAQHSGLPALADDAGLCVDAFGGLPGVDTAYYATQFGYPKGDANNVRALLEQMRDHSQAPRRAGQHAGGRAQRRRTPSRWIAVGRVQGEISARAAGHATASASTR